MRLPRFSESEFPPHAYAAGTVIFAEGQPGDMMYFVKEGEVNIQIGSRVVETLGPESIVGEMALIDNAPRSATAIAKTDCQLLLITQKQFIFLVEEAPFFALEVMRVMSQRLRSHNSRMAEA